MSCCGNNRQSLYGGNGMIYPNKKYTPSPGEKIYHTVAMFEYLGTGQLTVTGPRTGKQYYFEKQGAVVAVDLRDHPSLLGVPNLRLKM